MNKVTFTPAVNETKVVEVSPATVTINLTVTEAAMLLAITDMCELGVLSEIYRELSKIKDTAENWPEYETIVIPADPDSSPMRHMILKVDLVN